MGKHSCIGVLVHVYVYVRQCVSIPVNWLVSYAVGVRQAGLL